MLVAIVFLDLNCLIPQQIPPYPDMTMTMSRLRDTHLGQFLVFNNESGFTGIIVSTLAGVFILVVALAFQFFVPFGTLGRLPHSQSQCGSYHKRLMAYLNHSESLYREGYRHFKEQIYRMTTTDGLLCPKEFEVGDGSVKSGSQD